MSSGSMDTEQKDVAVNPHRRPVSSRVVTIVTPLGNRAIASRKVAVLLLSRPSSVGILLDHRAHLLLRCVQEAATVQLLFESRQVEAVAGGSAHVTPDALDRIGERERAGALRVEQQLQRGDTLPSGVRGSHGVQVSLRWIGELQAGAGLLVDGIGGGAGLAYRGIDHR